MKKLGIVIGGLIIVILSVLFGRYIGRQERPAGKVMAEVGEAYEKESQAIAVVNLDEGSSSEKGKEKIYYAERVIQFPDDGSFSYTSLEDARKGVEQGTYAAYIIIPATFSESIESINVKPKQAQLQYTLGSGLSADTRVGALYQVLTFGKVLNADISYMYLANLLRDFHDAQDGANTVMSNDLKDKAAIENIQASDLIKMVSLPSMEPEENTTQALDISKYTDESGKLIQDIDSAYQNNIDDTKTQLESIQERGKQFSDALEDLSQDVEEVQLLTDKQGQNPYDQDLALLKEYLATYNKGLDTRVEATVDNIDLLETRRTEIAKVLDSSISDYNQDLQVQVKEFLIDYYGKLKDVITGLTYNVIEEEHEDVVEISCQPIEGQGAPPIVRIHIQIPEVPITIEEQCIDTILDRIRSAGYEQETLPVEGVETTITVDKAVSTVFRECDEDADLLDQILSCGYSGSQDMFEAYLAGEITFPIPKPEYELEGDIDDIRQYYYLGFDSVDTSVYSPTSYKGNAVDNNGNPITDANNNPVTVKTILKDYEKLIQDTHNQASRVNGLNTEETTDIVKDTYILPLLERTEDVKADFKDNYAQGVTRVGEYQEVLDGYNPVLDTSKINENITDLKTNTSQMEQDTRENNQAYVDYSNKVTTKAEEKVIDLQTHIQEAKDISSSTVEEGLTDAKSIKETTSSENQLIMSAFSKKLPYTRLGTMEYTQAYEFLANPLEVLQISTADKEEHNNPEYSETKKIGTTAEKQNNDNDSYVLWVLYIIAGVGVAAVIFGYFLRTKRYK